MFGSRIQVFKGTRKKTTGGLEKKHLTKNSKGKVVSKKAQTAAQRKSNLGTYIQKKQVAKPKPKPKPKPAKGAIPKGMSQADQRKWLIKKLLIQKKTDSQVNDALKKKGFRSVNQKTLAAGRAWVSKKLKR